MNACTLAQHCVSYSRNTSAALCRSSDKPLPSRVSVARTGRTLHSLRFLFVTMVAATLTIVAHATAPSAPQILGATTPPGGQNDANGGPYVFTVMIDNTSAMTAQVQITDRTTGGVFTSTQQPFTTLGYHSVTVPNSAITLGHQFSWVARVIDTGGTASPWSTVAYFYTAPPPPDPPTPLVPGNASASSPTQVDAGGVGQMGLQFNISGALSAAVQVTDVGTSAITYSSPNPVALSNYGNNTITFPTSGLVVGHTYAWTVRAFDSSGSAGNWSSPLYFTLRSNTAAKSQQSNVTISPTSANPAANGNVTFTAGGGSGTGAYVWGGAAAGQANGTQVTVTFPTANLSTSVTVYRAGDTNYLDSNTASATVNVGAAQLQQQAQVNLTPGNQSITVNSTVRFTASGGSGTGAYVWGGAALGKPDGISVDVTFPNANVSTFVSVYRAADSTYAVSNTASSTIQVGPSLLSQSISLASSATTINTGDSATFSASGSNTGYTWTIPSGVGGFVAGAAQQTLTFPTAGSYSISVYAPSSATYDASAPATVTLKVTTPVATKFNAKDYITALGYEVRQLQADGSFGAGLFSQLTGVVGQIVEVKTNVSSPLYSGTWYRVAWDDVAPGALAASPNWWTAETGLAAPPSGSVTATTGKPDLSSAYYTNHNQNHFWPQDAPPAETPPTARGNCTWYAFGRMLEYGYSLAQLNAIAPKRDSNADRWGYYAKQKTARDLGVTWGTVPRPQSIAQHASSPGDTNGHVAVVEWVSADGGTYLVSESSYTQLTDPKSQWNFLWRRRLLTTASQEFETFIYPTKTAGTAQTLVGSIGSNASAMGSRRALAVSIASNFAATVNATNTSGTLVGYIASINAGFTLNFTLLNGAFTASTNAVTSGIGASGQKLTFSGSYSNGVLSGSIAELGLNFSATADPSTGASSTVAGFYQATGDNGMATYSVIGTQSNVFVLAVTPSGVSAGTGTVNPDNSFSVTASLGQSATIAGSIDTSSAAISSTITTVGGGASVLSGVQVLAAPVLTTIPSDQTVANGSSITLTVAAAGTGLSYQWLRNDQTIAGATSPTLVIQSASSSDAGSYAVSVLNAAGIVTSQIAKVTVLAPSAHLINLSFRAPADGSNVVIVGFAVSGGSKAVLIRGVGPSLTQFGVTDALQLPLLTMYDAHNQAIAVNGGWGGSAALAATFKKLGAFDLAATSTDCALVQTVNPGTSTAIVSSVAGKAGTTLAEIYDADSSASARLINISGRAAVTVPNGNNLTAGFVVHGTGTEKLLVRAVGPGLIPLGLTGVLSTPILVLYDATAVPIATNAGWANQPSLGSSKIVATVTKATADDMVSVGAFPISPGSSDCAMVIVLPEGNYSAVVNGLNGTTGTGIVEIYEMPK